MPAAYMGWAHCDPQLTLDGKQDRLLQSADAEIARPIFLFLKKRADLGQTRRILMQIYTTGARLGNAFTSSILLSAWL